MMPRQRSPLWVSLSGHRSLKGRAGHTATLVNRKLFVIGGRNGNEFFNDLWEFDIDTNKWKLLQKHTPFAARAYHTATLMQGSQLWVIGGSDHLTMYGDVHVLDTDSLEWTSPSTRGQLAGRLRGTHAAIMHPVQTKAILVYGGYGGINSQWLHDLSILSTDTLVWEELQPQGVSPRGRGYHTLTAFGTHVILYGGKGDTGIVSSEEISVYDAAVNVWITPRVRGGVVPVARSNHAATMVEDDLLVIHGGRNGSRRLSDLCLLRILSPPQTGCVDSFAWHIIEQEKTKSPKKSTTAKSQDPGGRSAHTLVAKDSSIYLFGGYGGGGVTFSDIFAIHGFPEVPVVYELLSGARSRSVLKGKAVRRSLEEMNNSHDIEGWRTTKQPRRGSHPTAKVLPSTTEVHVLDSDDNMTENNDTGLPVNSGPDMEDDHGQRSHEAPIITRPQTLNMNNAEQMARTNALLHLRDRNNTMTAREKELQQNELARFQQILDSLKAELNGKSLLESELRSGKAALEQNIQLLQKQVEEGNRMMLAQKSEIEKLKSIAQDSISQLDEKEKEREETAQKLRRSEQKIEELMRSLEQMKIAYSGANQELSLSRLSVKQLQMEDEKTAQALQQLQQTYEIETAAFTKEIGEKRSFLEKLSNELEVSKASSRVLQETLERLAKHVERDSSKIDALQNEQAELKIGNSALSVERDQLIAARDGAEATTELVKEELRIARTVIERNGFEIGRLKENAEQTKDHIASLHASLKKNEDEFNALQEENRQFRALMKDIETFENDQMRNLQNHVEKLRCARNFRMD